MKPISIALAVAAAFVSVASLAAGPDYDKAVVEMIKSDFKSKGPATVERVVNQDEAQKLCSQYHDPKTRPKQITSKIEADEMKTIKYPADGKFLGDWKAGEKIAQSGKGMQSSDKVGEPNGGNCYACHQITKEEISFGNIGPSLYHYGKLRGNSDQIMKYTWAKIYDAQAYTACSNMPRFGHNGILTEAQMKDVMALLLDPQSPANK